MRSIETTQIQINANDLCISYPPNVLFKGAKLSGSRLLLTLVLVAFAFSHSDRIVAGFLLCKLFVTPGKKKQKEKQCKKIVRVRERELESENQNKKEVRRYSRQHSHNSTASILCVKCVPIAESKVEVKGRYVFTMRDGLADVLLYFSPEPTTFFRMNISISTECFSSE